MKKTSPWGRSGVALLLSLIVLTMTGCSAAGPDGAEVSNQPEMQVTDLYGGETPASDGGSTVPSMDGFPPHPSGWLVPSIAQILGPSVEQQVVIEQGSYALVRHCMAERGFELLDEPPAATPAAPLSMGYDVMVGIISQERASQTGYQLREGDFGISRRPNVTTRDPRWTREYERAYKGDDGCLLAPDEALAEGVVETTDEDGRFANDIDRRSVEVAWSEPAVTAVLDRWRSCMAQEGYSYSTPKEASNEFYGFSISEEARFPGDATATPTEIVTAVRDAFCKAETGFVAVWQRELWRVRWTMVQDNLPGLLVTQEATARRVANAQGLIERYG
ncbi:MAG: hypothetical protein LBK54_00855 [Propionibacteriaceae bacterium]|jgi:hypothetical protein|nr:hypothetical protein [Propionibacteriaceae bacterium]